MQELIESSSYHTYLLYFQKKRTDHAKHLNYVFPKLKGANIFLNRKKFKFFKREIKILGNIVGFNVVRPDSDKTRAISKYTIQIVKRLNKKECEKNKLGWNVKYSIHQTKWGDSKNHTEVVPNFGKNSHSRPIRRKTQ